VTDVDRRAGRDYAGQPDGASVALMDNGPTAISSTYMVVFDKDAPNFGLIPPPEADFFRGFFDVQIPLGGDINGNGEMDMMKFTLGSVSVGDENRTFVDLPDGTVLTQFDVAGYFEGAVVDVSADPPFTLGSTLGGLQPNPSGPGALTGPSSATGTLQNPVVPEPGAGVLLGLLFAAALGRQRQREK
jgi:hypothetical protein